MSTTTLSTILTGHYGIAEKQLQPHNNHFSGASVPKDHLMPFKSAPIVSGILELSSYFYIYSKRNYVFKIQSW